MESESLETQTPSDYPTGSAAMFEYYSPKSGYYSSNSGFYLPKEGVVLPDSKEETLNDDLVDEYNKQIQKINTSTIVCIPFISDNGHEIIVITPVYKDELLN